MREKGANSNSAHAEEDKSDKRFENFYLKYSKALLIYRKSFFYALPISHIDCQEPTLIPGLVPGSPFTFLSGDAGTSPAWKDSICFHGKWF